MHVLWHTFVSHFMIKGGNILVSQRVLGHSTPTTMMCYARLVLERL